MVDAGLHRLLKRFAACLMGRESQPVSAKHLQMMYRKNIDVAIIENRKE